MPGRVPDVLSSTNKRGAEPRNLISGETDYFNLSVSVQSLPVPSNIVLRECVIRNNGLSHSIKQKT